MGRTSYVSVVILCSVLSLLFFSYLPSGRGTIDTLKKNLFYSKTEQLRSASKEGQLDTVKRITGAGVNLESKDKVFSIILCMMLFICYIACAAL